VHGFSADGKYLLYNDGLAMFILDVVTGGKRLVPNSQAIGFLPQLSPDQRWVYFLRQENHVNSLYRMPLEPGGAPSKIMPGLGLPAFSPDGKSLAVMHSAIEQDQNTGRIIKVLSHSLVAANADGSGQRVVASYEPTWSSNSPVWSPEGDRVAFRQWRSKGDQKLMVTSIRTGETTELAPWNANLDSLLWPSAGGGLYALRHGPGEKDPMQVMYCSLPNGQWTQVSGDLPTYGNSFWGLSIQATAEGLVGAATRSHIVETFWGGLLEMLWKMDPSGHPSDVRSDLMIIRLRRKQD